MKSRVILNHEILRVTFDDLYAEVCKTTGWMRLLLKEEDEIVLLETDVWHGIVAAKEIAFETCRIMCGIDRKNLDESIPGSKTDTCSCKNCGRLIDVLSLVLKADSDQSPKCGCEQCLVNRGLA